METPVRIFRHSRSIRAPFVTLVAVFLLTACLAIPRGQVGESRSQRAAVSLIAVAAGPGYTGAVDSDGQVWAWGGNWDYQLGDGTQVSRSFPAIVHGVSGVTEIDTTRGTLARTKTGEVWTWGGAQVPVPIRVGGLPLPVRTVANGAGYPGSRLFPRAFVILDNSELWGWGGNGDFNLGIAAPQTAFNDQPIGPILKEVRSFASAGSTLASDNHGEVWAWGLNVNGELGFPPPGPGAGESGIYQQTPKKVPSLINVVEVASGQFLMALLADGTVQVWGGAFAASTSGAGGTGNIPTRVPQLAGVKAIAGNYYNALALKSDGTVWAWGANDHGQLGNGTRIAPGQRLTPSKIEGLQGITQISVSPSHAAALEPGCNVIWIWGDNREGQLGDGRMHETDEVGFDYSARPVPVALGNGEFDVRLPGVRAEEGCRLLRVSKVGNGRGTVISNPGDLFCSGGCREAYGRFSANSRVTLIATTAPGSFFSGWGGACVHAGRERVTTITVGRSLSCTATFVTLRPADS